EGSKMLPFLREGSEAMRAMADEAENLGLVVGDKAAKESADFARDLGTLTETIKALVASVARELSPVLRKWTGDLQRLVNKNRELLRQRLREFFEELIPKIVELAKFAASLARGAVELTDKLGGLETALTIAAVAFGALQVAALGIPGVVAA